MNKGKLIWKIFFLVLDKETVYEPLPTIPQRNPRGIQSTVSLEQQKKNSSSNALDSNRGSNYRSNYMWFWQGNRKKNSSSSYLSETAVETMEFAHGFVMDSSFNKFNDRIFFIVLLSHEHIHKFINPLLFFNFHPLKPFKSSPNYTNTSDE